MKRPPAPDFRVELVETGPPALVLRLHGVIDEHADLGFLEELAGRVRLILSGIRRVNSYGVRSWIDAIRAVPAGTVLELEECTPPVIDQINMVAGFVGNGQVLSFDAPLTCEGCGHEENHLFLVEECRKNGNRLPTTPCPDCGRTMELDDVEDQYLSFLKE